ncbi:Ankyrin repeat-containing protein [Psilocybe cubensis]|uniref:Ankyrin n=2 Tax=Psilocybe cubensis TaxID=181762 RepID=A0A8H7Y4A5_PSICU|nr:Ankyrin repeat-containing protein [Psilocybe cubensis]KAH9486069.1 Ankyrin repeat-containing protein [Psilocybe cubensis]
MADENKGASNNERLLAAARDDNEDLLLEIFEQGDFDINCQDGVMHGSTDVLEHILSHEDCDVDPINRLDKATPLHLAVQIQHTDLRLHIFDSLLEAGADTSIKDKNGETVIDLLPADDTKLRALIRKHQAQATISRDDVASDGEDEGGSGSGSDED